MLLTGRAGGGDSAEPQGIADAGCEHDPVSLCKPGMDKRKLVEIAQIVAGIDVSKEVNPGEEEECQQRPASKRACADHGLSENDVYALRRRLQNKLCEEALEDLQDAIVRPEDLDEERIHCSEDPGQEPAGSPSQNDESHRQSKPHWSRPMTFVAKQRVLKTASIVQALLCFGVINAVVFQDVFMPPDEFKKFATELGCNRCTGLQALCMDWTNLEAPADLASALRTNTTLSALDINNACLSQDDTQQLAEGIAENGRRSDGCISYIDLSNNDMRAGGAAAIVASLVGNPRVTSLRLAYNNLGVEGAKAVAKFLPGLSLTSLNLSGNALRDGGVKALAKALKGSGCIHIADLALAHNGITDISVKCLADALVKRKASGVQGLGMLNIGYNMIRVAGARALSSSIENGAGPNNLILRGNPIGDAGTRALSRAAANGRLTAADLHACGIRTGGATALAKALEQATCVLSSLDIGGNAVRASGAEAIAAALREGARWTLSSLDISRNSLGLEGVSKLASSVALSSSLVHLNARNNAVPEKELPELRKKVGCGGEALERLSEAHVLALCMSGHKRLGSRSCAGWIDGALLQMIASLTDTVVPRSVQL